MRGREKRGGDRSSYADLFGMDVFVSLSYVQDMDIFE